MINSGEACRGIALQCGIELMSGRIEMVRDRSGWLVRHDPDQSAIWRAEGTWTDTTLADHAREAASQAPDEVLLVDGDVEVTARQLLKKAEAAGKAMISSGLRPGDVISLMLPNWHEAAILNLGATLAGLVVNPIIPIYRGAEVLHILRDSGSRMVFMPATSRAFDYRELAREVSSKLERAPEFVVLRGEQQEFIGYKSFLERGTSRAEFPETRGSDVMMVLYTSGTTGKAKGVLLTHNSGEVMVRDYDRCWGPWQGQTLLVASPVTHITGVIQALFVPIVCRAKVVLMDIWDPARALDLMIAHQANFIGGATPFHQGFLAEARKRGEHMPSLRIIACGGASVPPGLMRAEHEFFPNARVFRGYGCSEVPSITEGTARREDIEYGAETDGWIGRTKVRLVRPGTDEEVAQGEEGEILAFGAQIMAGYSRPEDNEAVFSEDGFFRTGDLGRMRDGYLTVTGRIKDLIIRNGENLSAKEIEDALEDLPGAKEVSVVGVPDARTGERVCVAIVVATGANPTLEEVAAHIAAKGLARQKTPEQLCLVDALPRNLAGKVLKDVIRAEVVARLQADADAKSVSEVAAT